VSLLRSRVSLAAVEEAAALEEEGEEEMEGDAEAAKAAPGPVIELGDVLAFSGVDFLLQSKGGRTFSFCPS
jgi:hypothetical protein